MSPPLDEKFVSISSGDDHTCALRADGSPVCWGSNSYISDYMGQATPPTEKTFTNISSGGGHTCGLRADGSPGCWGSYLLAAGSPLLDKDFTAISSGGVHTCALRADGSPVCWGSNAFGKASPPSPVSGSLLSAVELPTPAHSALTDLPSAGGMMKRARRRHPWTRVCLNKQQGPPHLRAPRRRLSSLLGG